MDGALLDQLYKLEDGALWPKLHYIPICCDIQFYHQNISVANTNTKRLNRQTENRLVRDVKRYSGVRENILAGPV